VLEPRAGAPNRLFAPGQIVFGQPRAKLQRLLDRPALVDVCGQHAIANEITKRSQIGIVGRGLEADLQLQPTMPPLQGGLGHLSRSGRVDSAGIDLDLTALPAEELPQCRLAPPRVKVPDREVDARDCLRERARLARLQREYRGALLLLFEELLRV